MVPGGDPLASLISALRIMRLATSFDVAFCAIFSWDYILTFRLEVDLVWKSKWNFMTGLYLLQRYLPFIDTIGLVLYCHTGGSLTKSVCRNVCYVNGVMSLVGVAASEMLLTLRTWAVWGRNNRLSIILPILYALFWGSGFVILGIFLNSVTFGDPPYPGLKGCFLTHANEDKDLVFIWVILILWDTLMLILILVPAIRAYRSGGNSALIKVVYRDGVVYYLYLFVHSLINIAVVKSLPPQYQNLLASTHRVLHSMLASRVLLHIRALAGDNLVWSDGPTELSTNSDIKFSSQAPIKFSITNDISGA